MRKINEKGFYLIKYYEGFSDKVYICPAGFRTIGYGHKLLDKENYEYINKHDAEKLLIKDLEIAESGVRRYVTPEIGENQFSALVSFTYNLGVGTLQRSTLRQKINYDSCLDEIYNEFVRWIYCNGVKVKGLIYRRRDEANLYCF